MTNNYQVDCLMWHSMKHGVYLAMPASERAALNRWKEKNLDGCSVATSDWPGWTKYLPPPPWKERQALRSAAPRKPLPRSVVLAVFKRDGFFCGLCGVDQDLSIDHIQPRSRGGSDDLRNLRVLCQACNSRKGAREP